MFTKILEEFMKRLTLFAILSSLTMSATGAFSQNEPSVEACQSSLEVAWVIGAPFGARPATPVTAEVEDGWCIARNIQIPPRDLYEPGFSIDKAIWRGEGLGGISSNKFPTTFEFELHGFRIRHKVDEPLLDYLFEMQSNAPSAGIQFRLRASRDAGARTLKLHYFDAIFPGNNRVNLNFDIESIDLSSVEALQMSATSFVLRRAELMTESNGLFEQFFIMPLGNALLYGVEDPKARVDELRSEAKDWLSGFPEFFLPEASRTAAFNLIDDLPNPTGVSRLVLEAPESFSPAMILMMYGTNAFLPGNPDFAQHFQGLTATVDYRPVE